MNVHEKVRTDTFFGVCSSQTVIPSVKKGVGPYFFASNAVASTIRYNSLLERYVHVNSTHNT